MGGRRVAQCQWPDRISLAPGSRKAKKSASTEEREIGLTMSHLNHPASNRKAFAALIRATERTSSRLPTRPRPRQFTLSGTRNAPRYQWPGADGYWFVARRARRGRRHSPACSRTRALPRFTRANIAAPRKPRLRSRRSLGIRPEVIPADDQRSLVAKLRGSAGMFSSSGIPTHLPALLNALRH